MINKKANRLTGKVNYIYYPWSMSPAREAIEKQKRINNVKSQWKTKYKLRLKITAKSDHVSMTEKEVEKLRMALRYYNKMSWLTNARAKDESAKSRNNMARRKALVVVVVVVSGPYTGWMMMTQRLRLTNRRGCAPDPDEDLGGRFDRSRKPTCARIGRAL